MTAFSTITVTLRPVDGVEEEKPDDEFSIVRIFESAWDRSTGALEGIVEVVIVLAIFGVLLRATGGTSLRRLPLHPEDDCPATCRSYDDSRAD